MINQISDISNTIAGRRGRANRHDQRDRPQRRRSLEGKRRDCSEYHVGGTSRSKYFAQVQQLLQAAGELSRMAAELVTTRFQVRVVILLGRQRVFGIPSAMRESPEAPPSVRPLVSLTAKGPTV